MSNSQKMWSLLASAVLVALCTSTWADSDPAEGDNSTSRDRMRPNQILFEVVSSTN